VQGGERAGLVAGGGVVLGRIHLGDGDGRDGGEGRCEVVVDGDQVLAVTAPRLHTPYREHTQFKQ
jgi:hypothetical protein